MLEKSDPIDLISIAYVLIQTRANHQVREMWPKIETTLLLITIGSLQAEYKIWRQSLDLGNPKLWLDNQLPCPGQRMVLPEERVVFFPASLTIGIEMVLPTNGMVLFPKDFNGNFLPSSDHGSAEVPPYCSNAIGDAVFLPRISSFWHDPVNWRVNEDPSPVPHLNQIPCRFDHVVFPSNAAYMVSISHHETHIGRLTIDQVGFDTTTFKAMTQTSPGSMMFRMNQSLLIHQDHCTDALGCECGNTPIFHTVCQLSGAQCGPSQCSNALKPFGHCCYDMCGSVIHIDTLSQNLKLSLLEEVIQAHVKPNSPNNEHGSNVDYHINRINTNEYEIIFVDSKGDIQEGIDIGRLVHQELLALLSPKSIYLWLEESDATPPSALKSAGKALGYLLVIALTVTLVYFALFVFNHAKDQKISVLKYESWSSLTTSASSAFSFYKFRKTQPESSVGGQFSFNRLSEGQEMHEEIHHSDDGSPAISISEPSSLSLTFKSLKEAEDAEEADESQVRSFTNPLFEKVPKSALDKVKEDGNDSNSLTSEKSFINPLFDESQEEETKLEQIKIDPDELTVPGEESNLGIDNPNYEVASIQEESKTIVQEDTQKSDITEVRVETASDTNATMIVAQCEGDSTVQGFENPNYQEGETKEINPVSLDPPKIPLASSATSFDNPNYEETPKATNEEPQPPEIEDVGPLVDLEPPPNESTPAIKEDELEQSNIPVSSMEGEGEDPSPDSEKIEKELETPILSPPTITITPDQTESEIEPESPLNEEGKPSLIDI